MNIDNDFYQFGDLKVLVKEFYVRDNNIKGIYDDFKAKHKNINIVILNSNIVFGLEHILSIIKIINEKINRKGKREIKNLDIEFLLRICYTDQIDNAFQKLNDDDDEYKNNNDDIFICILFSKNLLDVENALKDLKEYVQQRNALKEKRSKIKLQDITIKTNSLIEMSDKKKQYILKLFFQKELKDINELFFIKDNSKFQKFLVERSAIALK